MNFFEKSFFAEHLQVTALNICVTVIKQCTEFAVGKTVLLDSVQEFIEIEAWLLLTFFLGSNSQLISINSIATY